jgi:hypothetical protein
MKCRLPWCVSWHARSVTVLDMFVQAVLMRIAASSTSTTASLTRILNNRYAEVCALTIPPFTSLPLTSGNLLAVDDQSGVSKLQAADWSLICSVLPLLFDSMGDTLATKAAARYDSNH